MRRLGAEPVDDDMEAGDVAYGLIRAERAEGGTVLIEWNGFSVIIERLQRPLSAGTVSAGVFRNVNHDQEFVHWADGHEVFRLDPALPSDSLEDEEGAEPFLADLRAVGLLTGDGEDGPDADAELAVALAMRVTGVTADPALVSEGEGPRGLVRY
ncbi:hypothetical protein D5H75_34900 [Bailinhaonella thermotolerans]|uniref:Uncharacterized protein n=1 Tax=Bailinhaonella thermotolerans TaxID=1070861 RepID=A0A3A4A4T4_9ACTN|nr:hypothetical protein D5H75_34900 [Bailinhaonella thermotolerans]